MQRSAGLPGASGWLLLCGLVAAIMVAVPIGVRAEFSYEPLINFGESARGASPEGGLTAGPDGFLYGTTARGGRAGQGTLFRIGPGGKYKTVHHFNADEGSPRGQLAADTEGNLFGITAGSNGNMAYRLDIAGQFTVLYRFPPEDSPEGGLIRATDGSLYGVTYTFSWVAGEMASTRVYKIDPAGRFSVLREFKSATSYPTSFVLLANASQGKIYAVTHSAGTKATLFSIDGNGIFRKLHDFAETEGAPALFASRIPADSSVYGATRSGGQSGSGIIYRLGRDEKLRVLHNFKFESSEAILALVPDTDGSVYVAIGAPYVSIEPSAQPGRILKLTPDGLLSAVGHFKIDNGGTPNGLALGQDGQLYGTTGTGGRGGYGTLFAMDTAGRFRLLRQYLLPGGANPSGPVTLDRQGNIYGTTSHGGRYGYGTIFRLTKAGKRYVVHDFSNKDGRQPMGSLLLSDAGSLYGIAPSGGRHEHGTAYALDPGGHFRLLHEFQNITVGPWQSDLAMTGDAC